MKIKTVPTAVFNAGLDKWLKLANGEYVDMWQCGYCEHFSGCHTCPLTKQTGYQCAGIDHCCDGLFSKYDNFVENYKDNQARKIASRIADFIISRCVYEVE